MGDGQVLKPEELLARASEARRANRLSDALVDAQEAANLCREAGDKAGVAAAVILLGRIARDQGRPVDALAHYLEAVAIYRGENDPLRLAHTVRHAGDIAREMDSLELGAGYYEESLKIYRQNKETPPLDLANAIRGFALLKDAQHDSEAARPLWQEARELYAATGVKAGVAECAKRLGG